MDFSLSSDECSDFTHAEKWPGVVEIDAEAANMLPKLLLQKRKGFKQPQFHKFVFRFCLIDVTFNFTNRFSYRTPISQVEARRTGGGG
jgi:hypothetical protein